MEDISERIGRITRELRALQLQLHWPRFQDSNAIDQDRILTHLLDAGLGHDLKRTVDLLSQFLWCYIESAAARTSGEGDRLRATKHEAGPGHRDAPVAPPLSMSAQGVPGVH